MEAYLAAMADGWADPRRVYAEARRARALGEDAREEIAALIGARASHTHFAPSPAVAAERIMQGIYAARRGRRRALITAIESPETARAARYSSADGVLVAPVDDAARVDAHWFARHVAGEEVAFAAMPHASAEVGTVQPIGEAHAATLAAKVPLVVDASATIGHVSPPRAWDALVASPAAWGAPFGLGVLALRPELRWVPAWADGAPWAPGSTSLPACVAAATALRVREQRRSLAAPMIAQLAASLRKGLAGIPDTVVHGRPSETLPHVVGATFVYADAEMLGRRLDEAGVAVASGCTCGIEAGQACPTLAAMGVMTHGFIRFGVHEGLDEAAIARVVAIVAAQVSDVRREAGALR